MITCAINNIDVVKALFADITAAINATPEGETFNHENYMKDLYSALYDQGDAESAAKYLQSVPRLIIHAKNTYFPKVKVNWNDLGELTDQFLADDGIKNIVSKYTAPPKDDVIKKKVESDQDEENKLQPTLIEKPEEPVTVITSDRYKTLSPFGGTLQNFIKVKPSDKEDFVVIETINPEKQHIINTFQKIKDIQAMSDVTDGINYEGKTLMFKPYNLDKFSEDQDNFSMLDTETRDEIDRSKSIIKQKANVDPAIAQVNKRVILVLTDQYGNNIYVDDNGNLTTKDNGGKLVYQFMRVVRKEGNQFTVKDIYNEEDQVMSPEKFADMTYDPKIDGPDKAAYVKEVRKEQQKQMKELFDLQQSAIKGEAPLLPITGITAGISSNLSKSIVMLNELPKFPGITDSVYDTIKTLPRDTAGLKKGTAVIELNGEKFKLDRPRITKELANEIADVMTSTVFENAAKIKYLEQFLPSNISSKSRKYRFVYNEGQKSIYFKEFENVGEKNPVGKDDTLTTNFLKTLKPEQVKAIRDRIVNVLLNGGMKSKTEGDTNKVFISYYSEGLKGRKQYLRLSPDSKSFRNENYVDFVKTLPAEVELINADPGFYNYSVSFTTPDTLLGKVIKEVKAETSQAADLQRELASARLNSARLDEAGTLAERLSQKREEEYFDRLSYLRGTVPTKPESNKLETKQILTEPGAPAPENPSTPNNEIVKKKGGIDLSSIPGGFDRKNFAKELISPIKILQSKKWWNSKANKPLRDIIDFERMSNIVNSDVYATFIVNAGILADTTEKMGTIKVNKANGSIYQNLTIYHEAWHAFSQLFLTQEQKIDLYTELQEYTDANGNQPYANKKFRELEEMLAEDFRNYVKSGKAKAAAPVRNTLFEKIINFLKQLFGKALNKFNKKDILIDSLNSPMAKELFDNLYIGRFNSYQASVDNALLYELDRGVRQVSNPNEDALSPQDSNQMVKTIDSAWSELIDDIYDARIIDARKLAVTELPKQGLEVTPENIEKFIQSKGLKSASIVMLTDPAKRAWMYNETKKRLEEVLKQETDKFKELRKKEKFNSYTTLKQIKDNAVAVMKNKKGEDKYFFLTSQITDFSKLSPSLKKGDRVKGLDYKDSIKIIGDFYKHTEITENGRPVDIVIIPRASDAELQFQNYKKAEKQKAYTDIEYNKVQPEFVLDEQQEIVRDNIRILQSTLANWGDERSGMIKYHMENTDYEVSKDKYAVEITQDKKQELDAEGNVIDETENTEGATTDVEAKTGTLSLQQMMSKETTYLIKSLFRVEKDKNGDLYTPKDRFGFKERADFAKVFTILAKTIGGERDRYVAYNKLKEEADKFPELKQLYEKKYPDPALSLNKYEYDISKQFWLDFARPKVRYMQLFAFNDDLSKTIDFRVKESSIAIDNTLNRWKALFKSTLPTKYIKKTQENISQLDLANVVDDFSTKGDLKPENALDFARAIAIDLDKNDNIQRELIANFEYYGLDYIFDIVKGFNELEKVQAQNPNSPELTPERKKYLELFKNNPVEVLRDVIPAGVLSNLTGAVKELTQLKRLAELQSKYGFDSATTGVIRANGNTGYQEMNWSSATAFVYALNSVDEMSQLWTDSRYNYMSYLNPAINSHTLQLSIIKNLFDLNTGKKIPGRSLELIAVDGTSMYNKKTVMKNGRPTEVEEVEGNTTTELDPYSKFSQEFHSMLLGGVAELPRHSEKKFSYGIKLIGGIDNDPVGQYFKGNDRNLYVEIDKFFKVDKNNVSEGDIYAIGGYMFPYLQGEFDRIKKFRGANKEEYLKFTGYNKLVNDGNDVDVPAGAVFSAFDSILRQETKNQLYALADEQLDVPLLDYLKGTPLRKEIFRDMMDYFNEKTGELDNLYFQKIPYVSKGVFEKIGYKADELNYNKLNNLKKDPLVTSKLLKAYLYNDFIHKYESAIIMYGDHAQWGHDKEDWSKRIPGSTSDGIGYLFDENTVSFINDVFNKEKTYAHSITKENTPNYDQFKYSETLNTAIIKDAVRESIYMDDMVESWKELYSKDFGPATVEKLIAKDKKAFEEMKEGDGMAYMTFDAYRTLHQTGRGWSMAQEDLFQKIVKGENVDPKRVKEFFPVYKLHYFGALQNDIIPARAMHKFAVIPLIPGVNAVEGNQLDLLHKKMMRENVQYVTFDSGSKGSNITSNGSIDNIFASKQDKQINEDVEFTLNPIYMANLKEVTVINEYFKGSLPIATQTRGIVLDNLYENGKLINEKNKKTVDNYLNAVKNYSNVLKDELLNEIGFEFIDGRSVGNLPQFIEVIREELKMRDTPEHLIRLLNTDDDKQLAMDLSLHPEADNVEKLLMSFLQNGLIKQKTNGEPLVQTPTTFTNGTWDKPYEVLTNPKEIEKWLGTNTLPFYIRNKGERSNEMKVALSLQGEFLKLLNGKHTDGEQILTIDRLNQVIKDPKWLKDNKDAITIFGPRIPNDATNTIEAATVWHFLPPAFGNSIIVPTEIVAKAGSDFDGDKLFMTFPNIDKEGKVITQGVENYTKLLEEVKELEKAGKDLKGKPSSRAIISQQKKFLQNQFKNAAVEILMLPENYAYLTKPNGTYLVDKYVDELEENKTGYNRYNNTFGQQPKTSAADKKGNRKNVISPTRVLEATYNLYKHDANLSLEPSLGIIAKLAKSHPIYKSIGALMPSTYRASAFNDALNKTVESGYRLPVVMRFDHNTTTNKQGETVISLAGEKTKSGSRITDVISHSLQGILDRAKESFPFELKLVPQSMDVFSYLLQAGVNEEEIFFFLNQPLVAEYFEKQRLKDSAYSKITGFDRSVSVANGIINEVLKTKTKEELQPLYDAINTAKLKYILNQFKASGKQATDVYVKIKGEKNINKLTLQALIDKLNDGGIAAMRIERLSLKPEMKQDSTFYYYSENINNTENFAFATDILSREHLGGKDISLSTLKDELKNQDRTGYKALALFMNYLELERQFKGMNDLQQTFSPDTSKLDTVQQIIKRKEAYEDLQKRESIDKDFLNRLLKESVLSSFNQDDLILSLSRPLFNLRLNPTITNYISNVFSDQVKGGLIRNHPSFGKGLKGQERFSTLFNNAVINYIYQNYMSNFVNSSSELVNIPEVYTDNRPVIVDDSLPMDVEVFEEGIAINSKIIEKDFATKAYLTINNSEDSYKNRGLDTFALKQDPFQTLASYYRYVIARESIRVNNPIEALENNKEFLRRVNELNDANAAYESYISERALAASFNNRYIMGKTKYSYSDTVMNLINEFGDVLKVNYPITAQLAPGENTEGAKVLQLNNKKEAQGELASTYYSNLRSLADPSIKKVDNVDDNNRISEIFNLFSLMMFYQHGVGNTKLGFVKVLDTARYKEIMRGASNSFTNNYLSEDTLDTIFNKMLNMDRFKNHLVEPQGFKHAEYSTLSAGSNANANDEVEMSFDEDEGENEVLVRLINQEDVDLFNQMVKKLNGQKPDRFFTSKTLFPKFYNSSTGKREGMPQTAIWIKNKYGTYDHAGSRDR